MTVHVAGGGLAGLAAALAASEGGGVEVVVHEAAPQPGGRCRSFAAGDGFPLPALDNGAHVILGVNTRAFAWLDAIGAHDRVIPATPAFIPFVDLVTGARWRVAVAGHAARALYRLRAFMPFLRAAFNARPKDIPLHKIAAVTARLLVSGRGALLPWIATRSLTETFIAPALDRLAARGVRLSMNDRLRAIAVTKGRAVELDFPGGPIAIGANDLVILALPPDETARLLPHAIAGTPLTSAIVNVHFALKAPIAMPDGATMIGLAGGTADWLFARGAVLTAMRSAANDMADRNASEIARDMWHDASRALDLPEEMPLHRVIRERRATWTGLSVRKRALPDNVLICGDWCMEGLPCTIDAALESGYRAGRRARTLIA